MKEFSIHVPLSVLENIKKASEYAERYDGDITFILSEVHEIFEDCYQVKFTAKEGFTIDVEDVFKFGYNAKGPWINPETGTTKIIKCG